MESNTNQLFPVFLKLNKLNVLVIGGGAIGLEKITAILNNSPKCNLTIIAKTISNNIKVFVEKFSNVTLIEKNYENNDIQNCDLVIAAVGDKVLAQQIANDAKEKKVLINAADKPDYCDFYLGSIVQKGHIKIAFSTNGKSPTLSKRLREVFDENFPNEINETAENLNELRKYLKGDFTNKVQQLNNFTKGLTNQVNTIRIQKSKPHFLMYLSSVPLLIILGYTVSAWLPFESIKGYASQLLSSIDSTFWLYILAGFTAQLIDGALGMAYGITATTFLLSLGISPAASSASVHASEVFTSGVSGLMHIKFGNVNNKLFKSLLIPGVIGAIIGAILLSKFEHYIFLIKIVVSIYTLILGLLIIFKALKKDNIRQRIKKIFPLAFAGGFLDSIGGGGWGPIVASTLIARGRNPKYAIGSVNLAEFFIALTSSLTFITLIGLTHWVIIFGIVIGGIIAAPIAAYFANKIPTKSIMIIVGIVVIVLSIKRLFF